MEVGRWTFWYRSCYCIKERFSFLCIGLLLFETFWKDYLIASASKDAKTAGECSWSKAATMVVSAEWDEFYWRIRCLHACFSSFTFFPQAKELLLGSDYAMNILENSGKMVILMQIVNASVSQGDRVLIFSQSLSTLTLIEEFLSRQDIPRPAETPRWVWKTNHKFRFCRFHCVQTNLDSGPVVRQWHVCGFTAFFLVHCTSALLSLKILFEKETLLPCSDVFQFLHVELWTCRCVVGFDVLLYTFSLSLLAPFWTKSEFAAKRVWWLFWILWLAWLSEMCEFYEKILNNRISGFVLSKSTHSRFVCLSNVFNTYWTCVKFSH